jgi:tetratricopeptide (TPR) repeat protein
MPKWWSKITKKKDSAIAAPSSDQTKPKDLFNSRGDDHLQNGEYSAAVLMFTEALRYAPTDTNILTSRSLAHLMSTPPSLDLALQDADAAIQGDPTNWRAWSQRGEALVKKGDSKGAKEALVNAVEFAKGMDKVNVRKSLADLQTRRKITLSTCTIIDTSPPNSAYGANLFSPSSICYSHRDSYRGHS